MQPIRIRYSVRIELHVIPEYRRLSLPHGSVTFESGTIIFQGIKDANSFDMLRNIEIVKRRWPPKRLVVYYRPTRLSFESLRWRIQEFQECVFFLGGGESPQHNQPLPLVCVCVGGGGVSLIFLKLFLENMGAQGLATHLLEILDPPLAITQHLSNRLL